MRVHVLGGFGPVVLVGVALTSSASGQAPSGGDSPSPSKWGGSVSSSSWFKGMFGPKQQKEPDVAPETRVAEDPAKQTAPTPRDEAGQAASERSREQATLLRRLAVCDQLKMIAYHNKDDALLHRAEQLEDRVQAAYSQRIAHLPASKAAPPRKDSAADAKSAASPSPLHSSSLPGANKEKGQDPAKEKP
jgi:hypothetical protein